MRISKSDFGYGFSMAGEYFTSDIAEFLALNPCGSTENKFLIDNLKALTNELGVDTKNVDLKSLAALMRCTQGRDIVAQSLLNYYDSNIKDVFETWYGTSDPQIKFSYVKRFIDHLSVGLDINNSLWASGGFSNPIQTFDYSIISLEKDENDDYVVKEYIAKLNYKDFFDKLFAIYEADALMPFYDPDYRSTENLLYMNFLQKQRADNQIIGEAAIAYFNYVNYSRFYMLKQRLQYKSYIQWSPEAQTVLNASKSWLTDLLNESVALEVSKQTALIDQYDTNPTPIVQDTVPSDIEPTILPNQSNTETDPYNQTVIEQTQDESLVDPMIVETIPSNYVNPPMDTTQNFVESENPPIPSVKESDTPLSDVELPSIVEQSYASDTPVIQTLTPTVVSSTKPMSKTSKILLIGAALYVGSKLMFKGK